METKGSATCFRVTDLDRALEWYTRVLAFTEHFRFGDYAGIRHGEVTIHLAGRSVPNARIPGQGSIYIFCDDVDAWFGEITGRGAVPQAPPKDYGYGMRDFVLTDPDGNLIGFGQESAV